MYFIFTVVNGIIDFKANPGAECLNKCGTGSEGIYQGTPICKTTSTVAGWDYCKPLDGEYIVKFRTCLEQFFSRLSKY